MEPFENNSIPCFLCGIRLFQRISIRKKPYFICDPCGIQLFIRKEAGIKRLKDMQKNWESLKRFSRKTPNNVFLIQEMLEEYEQTRKELEKLNNGIFEIFESDEKTRIREALKTRIRVILSEIEAFARKTEGKQGIAK